MPKIFEYLGIVIFFYAHEHEPIHVHARYGKFETKAEFEIENGKVVSVNLKNVKGAKPLAGKDKRNFEIFIDQYADQIVQKWIDFFVLRKEVTCERINKRIK